MLICGTQGGHPAGLVGCFVPDSLDSLTSLDPKAARERLQVRLAHSHGNPKPGLQFSGSLPAGSLSLYESGRICSLLCIEKVIN
jgi:hypothetical protein